MAITFVQEMGVNIYTATIDGVTWANITPESRFWQAVQDWIALGNTPLPQYTPSEIIENKRTEKKIAVKAEGLRRIQLELPGIKDIDVLELTAEMWLSIAPAARSATVAFQKCIDIYAAAKNAIAVLNGYTLEAEIDAYNPITDPTWPV